MRQEPFQPALERGQLLQQRRLDRGDGVERDQADHRAHLERLILAVRQVQHVVEELVLLVPQPNPFAADIVHRLGDIQEVLEELGGDVFVDPIVHRQLQRDRQHVQAEHAHPAGAVALLQVPAGRQRLRAVEHADVVQPQEAALEDIHALGIFLVDPPGEVQQQLVEHPLQKGQIARAALLLIDLIHAPGRPGQHRRVDIAKGPLVGRDLPIRVLEPLAPQQDQLLLGKLGIELRQRDAVERQIPGREPGVLPLVGHRDDVGGVEVLPGAVAPALAAGWRRWLGRVAAQPLRDIVGVELLRPEHTGEGLALDQPHIVVQARRLERGVEGVGLGLALGEDGVEVVEDDGRWTMDDGRHRAIVIVRRWSIVGSQPQAHNGRRAGVDRHGGSAPPLWCRPQRD